MNEPSVQEMLTIEISAFGGPEVLKPVAAPMPVPAEGEILIRVAAAGVNRPDVFQRLGFYPPPPGAPDTPGLEVAGEVVALGSGVDTWRLGDTVCALVAGGGYATFCISPAAQALPVPKGLSMVEAAAIPETFFTVWTNVFDRGRLGDGEKFLVHGGTSGIGTSAIMLAAALGAEVYTTARSDAKCEMCVKLGAKRAINYTTSDFVAEIHEATDGAGVDVILDMVGGSYIQRNIECLAFDGRLVSIAFLEGAVAEIDFRPIMFKRLTLSGSTLRPRPVAEKARIAESLRARVWPLFESGRIAPVIDSTFPLHRAADAHRRIEDPDHIGKIVLTIED